MQQSYDFEDIYGNHRFYLSRFSSEEKGFKNSLLDSDSNLKENRYNSNTERIRKIDNFMDKLEKDKNNYKKKLKNIDNNMSDSAKEENGKNENEEKNKDEDKEEQEEISDLINNIKLIDLDKIKQNKNKKNNKNNVDNIKIENEEDINIQDEKVKKEPKQERE